MLRRGGISRLGYVRSRHGQSVVTGQLFGHRVSHSTLLFRHRTLVNRGPCSVVVPADSIERLRREISGKLGKHPQLASGDVVVRTEVHVVAGSREAVRSGRTGAECDVLHHAGLRRGSVRLPQFESEDAVRSLIVVGNTLFFFAYTAEHGAELWRSNGRLRARTVPASVPSVFHSSPPLAASGAVKNTAPPNAISQRRRG
jgi:hypothetical protein